MGGVWTEGHGILRRVAQERSASPGTSAGVYFAGIGNPVINDAGHTAFISELGGGPGLNTTNDSGVWSDRGGRLRLVAREGAESPGSGGARFGVFFPYTNIHELVLNGFGDTAFRGALVGPDVDSRNNEGIWSEGRGSLHLVVREGFPAPGAAPGTNFEGVGRPVVNEAGQIVFRAGLIGPDGDRTNNMGIWVERADGLELVVRSREQFVVAPGDIRTISWLYFYDGSGNEDGRRSGFNDFGQLVFAADFTDGTSGIFVADLGIVPEPASAVLVVAATGVLPLRRRRGSRLRG